MACGEILVQSIRLTNDLIDCPGHGADRRRAAASRSTSTATSIDGIGLDAGILNNGFDSVTITNGTIHEFDYGVQLNPGTGAERRLRPCASSCNQEAGIALADADQAGKGNTIRDNTIVSNGYGIALFSGTRNAVIRDNALGRATPRRHLPRVREREPRSRTTRSPGPAAAASSHARRRRATSSSSNTLDDNVGAGIAVGEELLPSNDNRVERNTITGGGGGIIVIDSTGNQILVNVVRDSTGPGVVLELARNTLVRGNDLRGNARRHRGRASRATTAIESNNASGTLGTGIEIGALSLDNVVIAQHRQRERRRGHRGRGLARRPARAT